MIAKPELEVKSEDELQTPAKKTSENVNIGTIGGAEFQDGNKRIKGFYGHKVEDPAGYIEYLNTEVIPLLGENPEASRIIDRALVRHGVELPLETLSVPLRVEAVVPLGGAWEGYDWVMVGTSFPGRILSQETTDQLRALAYEADGFDFEDVRPLPEGFYFDHLKLNPPTEADLEQLAYMFRQSFITYISKLDTAEGVAEWLKGDSVYPIVVRNQEGLIVGVASGDLAEEVFDGQTFKFMEIGDSASDPAYNHDNGVPGVNRNIKQQLIRFAMERGFDSIHTETRAAKKSPNIGNAKNGMRYGGTLPMNCIISGPEDVNETSDPNIAEWAREMGSLNVWYMTPANPNWARYASNGK